MTGWRCAVLARSFEPQALAPPIPDPRPPLEVPLRLLIAPPARHDLPAKFAAWKLGRMHIDVGIALRYSFQCGGQVTCGNTLRRECDHVVRRDGSGDGS